MNVIWHDDISDQIRIATNTRSEDYAPRSLLASIEPDGQIAVRMRDATANVVKAPWSEFADRQGATFTTAEALVAYLAEEFGKKRSLDLLRITAVANMSMTAGTPVAVSRRHGSLNPARADTYALSFVVGLLAAPVVAGFVAAASRSPLTLDDWTAVAGAPALLVGQPYFLAPGGGLTANPDVTPGHCLVRVGNATGRQTLAPIQADPILI